MEIYDGTRECDGGECGDATADAADEYEFWTDAGDGVDPGVDGAG